jgi:hypothetical protein
MEVSEASLLENLKLDILCSLSLPSYLLWFREGCLPTLSALELEKHICLLSKDNLVFSNANNFKI